MNRQQRRKKEYRLFVLASIVLLLIGVSVFWWGVRFLTNRIVARVIDIQTVQWGKLEKVELAEAWTLRREKVLPLPDGVKLEPVVPDGQRVRRGEVIARLKQGQLDGTAGSWDQRLLAPEPGQVCYHVDGLESVLLPELVETMEPDRLWEALQQEIDRDKPASRGVKLLDNLQNPYFLLHLDSAVPWQAGKTVLKLKDRDISLLVKKIKQKDDQTWAILTALNDTGNLAHERKNNLELVEKTYRGFLVPASALTVAEGKQGLYIVYKEIAYFRPVKITGQVGELAAVEEVVPEGKTPLLGPGARVVVTPALVSDGQRVMR